MASPIFPNAPKEYDPAYVDQLLRVLTQGLNLLDAQKALLAGSTAQMFSVAPATAGTMAPEAGQLTGRNIAVNGSCQVDQVNSGAIISPLINGSYIVDNIGYIQTQTGKLSGQQITTTLNSLGVTHAVRYTVLSQYTPVSTDLFYSYIGIEGLNLAHLQFGTVNASPVSLQFKVRSSVTGTFSGGLTNAAINRSYPFSFAVIANTDTLVKIENIPGDTTGTWPITNTAGAYLQFDLGNGTNYKSSANSWQAGAFLGVTGATNFVSQANGSTFDVSDVQFEKGTYCTTFERKLYGDVLRSCQRHYETGVSYWDGYQLINAPVGQKTQYIVSKMANPTLVFSNVAYTNSYGATTRTATIDSFGRYVLATATGSVLATEKWEAIARL